MSIDFVRSGPGGGYPRRSGRIKDLIILYGGWGRENSGEYLAPGQQSGTSQLVDQIHSMTLPPFHITHVLSLQGSLISSGAGLDRGAAFIREHFDPRSRIVIYGYSAGGINALDLARCVQDDLAYYSLTNRQFLNDWQFRLLQLGEAVIGRVRVDLLVTVDAASGPTSVMIDRTVPMCVRRNLNFFQSTTSAVGSHGGPNQATSSSETVVENVDMTGQVEHADIDEHTQDRVLAAIRGVLGREVPAPPAVSSGLTLARSMPRHRRSMLMKPTGTGRGVGFAPRERFAPA